MKFAFWVFQAVFASLCLFGVFGNTFSICGLGVDVTILLLGACTDPFDALTIATEYLDKDLYRRASVSMAYWLELIKRSEFMSGTGLTHTTFTVERSEPDTDERAWAPITSIASGGTQACAASWNDVKVGHTTRLYSPEQLDLRSEIVCKDELIYTHQAARFMEAYLHALTFESLKEVQNRLQNIYMHFVPKNSCDGSYTAVDGGAADADHTPPTAPTLSNLPFPIYQLDQSLLDITAAELNTDGAPNPDESGWIQLGDEGPLYTLLIGQQMSQQLSLNNAEFRKDQRYNEPSMLMKRMGATKVIKNFRHLVSLTPPRWDSVNNAWYRQSAWEMVATTKGYKARLRKAYKDAAYEGAIVMSPYVMEQEVIRPVNAAADMSWNPQSYFGEWVFKRGGRLIDDTNPSCYDPLEKLGRHFGCYKHAPRIVFPEFGRLIIFKRCPLSSFTGTSCAGVS